MTTGTASPTGADTGAVLGLLGSVTRYWVAVAALDVGLFDSLAEGEATTTELAARCDVAAAPLAVLCGVLADAGLLAGSDGRWSLGWAAREHLVSGAPRPLDRLLVHGPGLPANLMALGAVTRGAPPPQPVDDDDRFWRNMFSATLPTQRRLAAAVTGTLARQPGAVLEIGPCAGAWAIEMLTHRGEPRAATECRAAVLADVVEAAAAAGVSHRLVGPPASGADGFDVLVLANALRMLDARDARQLTTDAVMRTAPGATVIVADYFVDAPGPAGVSARLMAATILANTRAGGALRADDVCEWLAGAGCTGARLVEPMAGFAVVIADRPVEVRR